jgi:hypothetical protein
MADWNNPEENTLLKERELAIANIRKAEAHADPRIASALQSKLENIETQLEHQSAKTKVVILTIMKLRSSASMEDYMPVVKEELAKKDQSQGLLLLGLYCLEEQDRA